MSVDALFNLAMRRDGLALVKNSGNFYVSKSYRGVQRQLLRQKNFSPSLSTKEDIGSSTLGTSRRCDTTGVILLNA